MRADLHIHTTFSDGVLTPEECVAMACECGLDVLAVTDHDTTQGLSRFERAAAQNGLRAVRGVEISAGGDEDVHVLGYHVTDEMTELETFLDAMRRDRVARARSMLSRLTALRMPLTMDDLNLTDIYSVGRPLIARAMVQKGYVTSVKEAFDRYLGNGCPAYEPRKKIPASEVISMLVRCGAVPVLAHPSLIKRPKRDLIPLIHEWKACGLRGLEAYHPMQTPAQMRAWDAFARKEGLLVTGGSDYHCSDDVHAPMGAMTALWTTCAQDTAALLDAHA